MHEIERNHRRIIQIKGKWGRGLLVFDTAAWKDVPPPDTELPPYSEFEQPRPAASGFVGLLWSLVQRFSDQTSIHGIRQICSGNSGYKERLFYAVAFVAALLVLIYVSLLIAARYNQKQFKTTVETTKFPVYRIAFPEVTVCNQNRLNWTRLEAAQRRFLRLAHQTIATEALFVDIVQRYDPMIFGQFDRFANISSNALETLNYVNFTEVVSFMAWRCDEMLANCTWEREQFDCCEIFLPRISQLGACLAFNTVMSRQGQRRTLLDPRWPWRTAKAGPNSGLSFRVLLGGSQPKPLDILHRGVTFMVTEPYVWYNFPIDVGVHTRTMVGIDADMNFFDDETRSVPSDERECVFPDEQNSPDFKTLEGQKYMFENCQSECQQRHLMHYCNCTMDLFFPPSSYPPCRLVDMPCLARNNEHLLYFEQPGERDYIHTPLRGMQCECFLNCFSLEYTTDVRTNDLKPSARRDLDQDVIEMQFFFERTYILVYRSSLVYTWIDLMVSFGGIAGLFLGCSLISMFDLCYFMLSDVPMRIWQQLRARQHVSVRSLKVRENVKSLLNESTEK